MTTTGAGQDDEESPAEIEDAGEAELVLDDYVVEDEGDEVEVDDAFLGGAWAGLGDLMAQAQDMQAKLLDARAAVAEMVVEGQAGGGVVKVTTTGGFEFRDVRIHPGAVDPADTDMLQDLVLAAIRDAVAKVNQLNAEALGGLGGALGGLLP